MISYRGFSKRYGSTEAVRELTLEVGGSEVMALLGPNGSGKTTSLKAAAGLIRPSEGEVLVGDPPRPALEPDARRCLSFLPQRVSFPEALSGAEVVEFYRALRGVAPERCGQVLRFASLNGAGARALGTYSGGMLQRLGLAVAMLPDAPLLMLDEPTAALDPDGLCAFYGVVARARERGRTVLFTSHQLGEVEHLADRFAVLVEGRLAACFTRRELQDRLAERGVMRLRLEAVPPGLLGGLPGHAPEARQAGDELILPGPAAVRPALLDRVRDAGGVIRGLTAEEGRLDAFYRELVAGGAGER